MHLPKLKLQEAGRCTSKDGIVHCRIFIVTFLIICNSIINQLEKKKIVSVYYLSISSPSLVYLSALCNGKRSINLHRPSVSY